jgi:hypothetical protein
MKYLGLASVLVLTLSLGMFIPQAGANSPKQEALALQKEEKQESLAVKKQEKLEALALKHSGNSSGNYVGGDSPKSVPIPGTLLLFGGVFAGLVWWRERQART